MTGNNTEVFGIFTATPKAEKAVSRLASAGFLDSTISILTSSIESYTVKDGDILVSVHCDTSEEIDRAKIILEQNGAETVSSTGERVISAHGVEM